VQALKCVAGPFDCFYRVFVIFFEKRVKLGCIFFQRLFVVQKFLLFGLKEYEDPVAFNQICSKVIYLGDLFQLSHLVPFNSQGILDKKHFSLLCNKVLQILLGELPI
jgi:hypothetical protein